MQSRMDNPEKLARCS